VLIKVLATPQANMAFSKSKALLFPTPNPILEKAMPKPRINLHSQECFSIMI